MSPATKAEALKKLAAIQVKVGYPDHWRDYSALEIRPDDLYGNVVRAAAHDWRFRTARINDPVDKGEWVMTPQTNNAYNGALNDIVFPAAILTPPIFNPDADPAINYGAVGGVIGHELTHGFDDQGRKYDATGALTDWWTAEDAKVFEARAAMLGRQFAAYEPLPGMKVNAELTMGENIADLGGLVMALDAYKASLKGKTAPVIDGLTGEQRVFLGWAQAWRGKLKDDALRRQVVSDPHSPAPLPGERPGAEHRRLVHGVRGEGRRGAVPEARGAGADLVSRGVARRCRCVVAALSRRRRGVVAAAIAGGYRATAWARRVAICLTIDGDGVGQRELDRALAELVAGDRLAELGLHAEQGIERPVLLPAGEVDHRLAADLVGGDLVGDRPRRRRAARCGWRRGPGPARPGSARAGWRGSRPRT